MDPVVGAEVGGQTETLLHSWSVLLLWPEILVFNSNKDGLSVLMSRASRGREPPGLPEQLCSDHSPPSSVRATVWARL